MKKLLIAIGLIIAAVLVWQALQLSHDSGQLATGQRWMENSSRVVYVIVDVGRGDSLKAKYKQQIELTQSMLNSRIVISLREGTSRPYYTQLDLWFVQKHTRLAD